MKRTESNRLMRGAQEAYFEYIPELHTEHDFPAEWQGSDIAELVRRHLRMRIRDRLKRNRSISKSYSRL